ncbi:hypothetical protein WEB32_34845 [Streptomyces netropsis]|uniref:hypothetical protein n=1 Tax=Streptomyces netropsis TaxID=55404 RepID=UPI0030D56495
MTRGDLTDSEWELIEPHLPLGASGPMEQMIARRGQADLTLVSVDSTAARAHHHAAGMAVDPELLEELEKAAREEKGLRQRSKSPR